jgi:hypothetical protein
MMPQAVKHEEVGAEDHAHLMRIERTRAFTLACVSVLPVVALAMFFLL